MIWQFFFLFTAIAVATVVVLEGTVGLLIPFFFGNQFAPSIRIARIALLGGLLLSARRLLADSLRGAGYPVAGTLAEASLLVVLLPALVVGGYLWGPEGMAGAVALAGCASLMVLVVFEARAMKSSASAQPSAL
jgi:O-antigen/teichoic acid export membrane protein